MIYNEQTLREIQGLQFNKEVNISNVESTFFELDPKKIYLVKVEVEDLDRDVMGATCFNLRNKLNEMGITNILIVPTYQGISAINFFELEPQKEQVI